MPRLIAVTLDGTDAQGLVRYTLEEATGGTTLLYECELRFRGLMALFAPLARGPAQARVDSDLARLKARVDCQIHSLIRAVRRQESHPWAGEFSRLGRPTVNGIGGHG